ncbi:hypothetical protein GCM10011344_12970 [Dokdonia pacifica]|uniref:Uncharacterized protein n=1 Tax=Dokdonia pacifica TaxID=1627892 RepID=A0A238WAR1_9FLAO|nr:hypothetical protein [Dokdonia pacifica]GGG13691.1 hypothetical protein GCM10011344_12970 [Dokdonia pacifica]SNR43364.1 hypothetical protein SAMN06265376_101854 [Dokdonia pacifica]
MSLGEIFKTANDRLKSPFLSSFIFSWIAFNWKAIFVALAGDENVYTKIDCIESDYIDFYSVFLYPLLVALFYTLAFPFITVFFQLFTEKARVLSIEAKSERELLAARKEFKIEQTKAGTDDLKELNDQIGKLKEDLKKASSGKQGDTETIAILNQKIDEFKKNQTQLEKDLKESKKELNTTNIKFSKWFINDKIGKNILQRFYNIVDDHKYAAFENIISITNLIQHPLDKSPQISREDLEYLLNKEVIEFKGDYNLKKILEEKKPLSKKVVPNFSNDLKEKINLTQIGINLKEFMRYYKDLNTPPF